ncbi:hypothetical protein V2K77_01735 [Pseudomonas alliivorans]|nr:hypothetical protein [Pseudomonas alliivorans]MEE4710218.1 hypothetical protein [Pseudomonas alliivorans]MEE4725175.1 hypothetical protein [Pseudomonas alliivorans]MEE4765964.1 hypothetical protein [Pseudomonas alliivorans]
MADINEKLRGEFEAWARKNSMDMEYRNIPGVGQFYQCPRTLLAFEVWQASREALVIELPKAWQTNVGAMLTPNGVRFAIQEAGVKVKP